MHNHQQMHQHLLDLLGAKDHEDAARIIAANHAREIAASQPAVPQGRAYAELPVDELRTNYLDLLQEVLDAKDVMLAAGCKQGTFAVMFAEYRASHGQAPAATPPADSTPSSPNRPSSAWYRQKIQETLDDDFQIGPAPQADSQPAADERDDFEKVFPLPSGCIRVGTGYASTGYSNWAAHTHCERWQGWQQARAARAPADSGAAPAATVIKKGADRQWMSERLGHLPDGIYSLYLAPPAQAADSVLEDAARYRLVRRGQHWSVINGIGDTLRGEELDAAVDAARKQGGA